MNWKPLTTDSQLQKLVEDSKTTPQAIFKHSTRCSISSMAKNRLEREAQPSGIDFYFLDLLSHRSLSQKIAEVFGIMHESPQILLIRNGECLYHESHTGISMREVAEQATLAGM